MTDLTSPICLLIFSRKASHTQNVISEAQWAARMKEMIRQICNTREGLQEVRDSILFSRASSSRSIFDIRVPFVVTAKQRNARVPHQVRVECKSTVEEVDVLSLRASEASAEIAFLTVLSLQARGIFAHDIT